MEHYYIFAHSFSAWYPLSQNWVPQIGDKYVLVEDSKMWSFVDNSVPSNPQDVENPAIITVKEIFEDSDFMFLNTNAFPKAIQAAVDVVTNASPNIVVGYIPCLFLGTRTNDTIVAHSGVAFNPGGANSQSVAGNVYFPRQYAPLDDASNDLFERAIKIVVPSARFVDSWMYHTGMGNVHCGSNVKRTPIENWWEKLPAQGAQP